MKKFLIIFAVLAVFATYGCKNGDGNAVPEETVELRSYKSLTFEEMPTTLSDRFTDINLQQDSSEFLLSSMSKAVKSCGKFYVFDQLARKICVFKESGEGDFILSRRGRGPQEYLRISDFDVDKDGNIWVLDGQKDIVYHYDASGEFVSSAAVPTDVDAIACLDGGGFLFGISTWNKSEYKDKQVIVCDQDLKIIDSCVDYDGNKDQNMEFPSLGFIHGENGEISYNHPIEDKVYVFSLDGKFTKTLNFDFGIKAVNKEYRSNIEPHMDDVVSSRFIVNGFVPAADFLAGCLLDEEKYANVIIDKGNETTYSTELGPDTICMIGGTSDCAIFGISSTGEEDKPSATLRLFKF